MSEPQELLAYKKVTTILFRPVAMTFLAIVIIIAIVVVLSSSSSSYKSDYYTSQLTTRQEAMINDLVNNIAPTLGTEFDMQAITKKLRDPSSMDAEIYYHFKSLLSKGELTVVNLKNKISGF